MAPAWYAHKSPLALFSLPDATRAQLRHAETVLKRQEVVPITDLEGHVGAVGLVRNHLRQLAVHRPERHELLRIVRAVCARPGFDVLGFRQSVRSRVTVGWIKPETITRGDLGERFKPYHWSSNGLAKMALRILDEQGDAESLLELFGCQRDLEIVVNSFLGPLGPVRPIAVNGNHRTLALEALGVPAVLAELQPYAPPYRCELHDGDEFESALPFLRWLDDRGGIRLASRPVVWSYFGPEVRVAEAQAPWILAPPWRAFEALDAYEVLKGRRLDVIGHMSVTELRRTWARAAREGKPTERADKPIEIVPSDAVGIFGRSGPTRLP